MKVTLTQINNWNKITESNEQINTMKGKNNIQHSQTVRLLLFIYQHDPGIMTCHTSRTFNRPKNTPERGAKASQLTQLSSKVDQLLGQSSALPCGFIPLRRKKKCKHSCTWN